MTRSLETLPPLLIPSPRSVLSKGAWVEVPIGLRSDFDSLTFVKDAAWVEYRQGDVPTRAGGLRPQSYRLQVSPATREGGPIISIGFETEQGKRFALATLGQLLRQFSTRLPAVEIEDWPSFQSRGLMLDVSRDRVPTMEHLFETVDLIASLKMNHLQLYTEHTFAYEGHEDVWRDWSPMTPTEVRRLDAYCQSRGVELAANQNCFGHLASWLRLPRYSRLAETHGDWVFDAWPRSGPFSLCPTDPASEAFVADLLGQLLPCFSSPLVNIGCDETYDIGYGRSGEEVKRHGRAGVYIEFLTKIASIARSLGKRSMFWADIVLSHPESVSAIPDDLISLAWGYEPDSPFHRWCELLAAANREFWVCPGTSSWRSITGRTSERRGNIASACRAGAARGAKGFLLCDWGDTGHHQQWPISVQGIADGAAAAWNTDASGSMDLRAASLHAFGDETLSMSGWLSEFGETDLALRETCGTLSRPDLTRLRNQSALFIDLFKNWGEQRDVGEPGQWRNVSERLDQMSAELEKSAWPMRDELLHSMRYAAFAAWRGRARRSSAVLGKDDAAWLRKELQEIEREHRRLWLRRSREGGLNHSCGYFKQISAASGV